MASDDAPAYEVRPARVGDEDGICAVCRAGFAESSAGLLSPATVERRSEEYYNPARVRHEILTGGVDHRWQGYVVAVSRPGDVLGAAGGGITDGTVGHLYVLYLDPALRGRGIGTALLDVVTDQQRETGVVEQWVSVTEGNDLGIPFYLARGFVVRDRVVYGTTGEGTPEACSLRMSRPV
ncbi:GNAT family N-acetyltransferase [Nocardioides baculatus]|uniref:GNAT family N-acetyltransferase n=1 Tax=Nocardioides baculatus TaxID=2801337 RepID=A0ABS1L7R3_9ACTN|nr:GNAT family N-acetyltransferase [Nocardioides baculatus]MBL0747563.1 GNAT family N-acetyltransferase [Nocardioides baculatus]